MNLFPEVRLRRLRQKAAIRKMLDMPMPGPEKFVWPVFVLDGKGERQPIDSMPGQYRLSVDTLLKELEPVVASGVGGILIFGLTEDSNKDAQGRAAYDENGAVQQAVRAVRDAYPELVLSTDVCLCAYTTHGHCGPLCDGGDVDNDAANALLAKVAVSHAAAGADCVAPSAMMDGQVDAIRTALDDSGFDQPLLMRYSTKFDSSL
jgi:porphobilinogen synthase